MQVVGSGRKNLTREIMSCVLSSKLEKGEASLYKLSSGEGAYGIINVVHSWPGLLRLRYVYSLQVEQDYIRLADDGSCYGE